MQKLNPKNDEILGNSIKQSTHQGGKEGTKKKDPSLNQKNRTRMDHKNGLQKGTKTNHVPKPTTIARSIFILFLNEKFKKTIDLENLHLQQWCASR